MKRYIISILLISALVVGMTGCLSGNAKNQETGIEKDDSDTLKIVSTIFPPYDWVREVIGEDTANMELTLLLDNGVDLHSYQPTAQDMATIAESDLFMYVGGESDAWVSKALEAVPDSTTRVINLMEVMGEDVKEEEVVEGMQEDDHDHEGGDEHDDHDHEDGGEHDDHDHEDHDHEGELDEHVWLSLRNAQVFTEAIAEALGDLNPESQEVYLANARQYNERLHALDEAYEEAVANATNRTILFGDRFPFRYLVDDYGLDYYAAFVGCSAETEASFETVAFLADKVDALQLHTIYVIESSDQSIANTILENTDQEGAGIAVMNSMQSVTKQKINDGITYIQLMEENLVQLEKGLQGE